MAIAFRANLQPFLADFIEHHRGLRIGSVWVKYTPRNAREAGRLSPILELAARHVAEAA